MLRNKKEDGRTILHFKLNYSNSSTDWLRTVGETQYREQKGKEFSSRNFS
jgi:hypothetical protein